MCVLLGFVVWMLVTAHIWQRGGGDPVDAMWTCILAGPMALVGARFYSAATDALRGVNSPPLDFSHGGLGIYGGILAGLAAIVVSARVRGWPVGTFLDCAVPGLALGQAIGRFGNYFNQELFGAPTSLPWGLRVDEAYRPLDYLDETTFHPVFLYEAMWDVTVFFLLIDLWPRLWERFRPGSVAARLPDPVRRRPARDRDRPHRRDAELAGVRFNQIASVFAIATGLLVLAMLDRKRRSRVVSRAMSPEPNYPYPPAYYLALVEHAAEPPFESAHEQTTYWGRRVGRPRRGRPAALGADAQAARRVEGRARRLLGRARAGADGSGRPLVLGRPQGARHRARPGAAAGSHRHARGAGRRGAPGRRVRPAATSAPSTRATRS